MEVSVQNTSTLGRKVKVSVPSATLDEKIQQQMNKLAKEAHLKGFRKGKIPLAVVKQKFGASVRNEVVNETIREALTEAFKDNGLNPAGMPNIDSISNEPSHDLEFEASFEVYPEITLAEFAGTEIERSRVEIKDSDISSMVEKLQDQMANWMPVERPVKKGDKLNVDFERLMKEEGAEKERQAGIQMTVGSDGVVPGLDDALIGQSKGAQITLETKYPEDWADKLGAGKAVTLWVTINDILEKEALTKEALASRMGVEGDDLTKLNEMVKTKMQEELDQVLKDELQEVVLEKLLEKNPIELPQTLLDHEKEAMRREQSNRQRVEIPSEAWQGEEIDAQAKRRVELGLLLNEVIKKYNLKADGQKVRAQIERIATRFPNAQEVVEAYYRNKELLSGIERMVLLEQGVEAILKEVTVTEKDKPFDEVMNPDEKSAG